ncbi:uncharacterized protein [Ptychodera flava]|uniref:uncharacterized protein n=1 Tax=Ptychodera flava TaxID=63121 RepID=UPI00396A2779
MKATMQTLLVLLMIATLVSSELHNRSLERLQRGKNKKNRCKCTAELSVLESRVEQLEGMVATQAQQMADLAQTNSELASSLVEIQTMFGTMTEQTMALSEQLTGMFDQLPTLMEAGK